MLCDNLENKNNASNAHDCGLAYGVLEGSKDSIRAVYVVFWIKNLLFFSTGAEESGMINKRPGPLKWILCFATIKVLQF